MRTVPVGVFESNILTGDLYMDGVCLDIAGLAAETFGYRTEDWLKLIHPEDTAHVEHSVFRSRSAPEVQVREYRLRRPDGKVRWVESRSRTLFDSDGRPTRVIGTLWDVTHTRMTRESVGRALRHMTDAFFVVDRDGRLTYLNAAAERLFGPAHTVLGRPVWDVAPVEATAELPRMLRQSIAGTPIELCFRGSLTQRWYHVRMIPVPEGLLVFGTDIHDMRSYERERSRSRHVVAERASRFAELTSTLAQSSTVAEVIRAISERVLPAFGASRMLFQTLERDRLRVVQSLGYPRETLERIEAVPYERNWPVREAFRTREPVIIGSPEELRQHLPWVTLRSSSTEWPAKAWVFLPLVVADRPSGCCVLSFDEPRRFSEDEQILLTAMTALISQAFGRAWLYDTEHNRAQQLQQGMLPRALPALPALTAAARYLPMTEGAEVGGDWYDVIRMSGGRVVLVIGDVMGHGLSEAVTMGRLRTAVHTLANLELSPDELLSHLNDLVTDLGEDFYATCLFAVYDPTTGNCVFTRAGHPPPALVHPDGTVEILDLPLNPPLGAATPPFDAVETQLPHNSLLVMYTDGLIESRARDMDSGWKQLAETLAEVSGAHAATGTDSDGRRLEELCDAITAALLSGAPTTDDAALLVARVRRFPEEDVASWPLSSDALAAGLGRKYVRQQLAAWSLEELIPSTELLVSELVGNVVRHARGPVRLRLARSDVLLCEVYDGSLTTPHIRRASESDEGGRGLQLVEAVSLRWGTRYIRTGKVIWTEQLLPVR